MMKPKTPVAKPRTPVAAARGISKAGAKAIGDKLQTALVMHQQGQLDLAEALYREILQSQPFHFDALQLLATIAAQLGNSAEAVELFDRALKIKPDYAAALCNRGTSAAGLATPGRSAGKL